MPSNELALKEAVAVSRVPEPVARPRGWNMVRESSVRSLTKALSWRLTGTLTTALLVFMFTGEARLAVAVGGLELVLKLLIYHVHERAWAAIGLGRHQVQPSVLWFTGLPGSGKSTLADAVTRELEARGYRVERLDGDTIRDIFPSTGFTREERDTHIQRVGFLASKLEAHGVFVVASFVSPYAAAREFVRSLCRHFVEIHVSTPLEVCEERDPKGLYARARRGEIDRFTGINDPYEPPPRPELVIDTSRGPIGAAVDLILDRLAVE